MRITGFINDNIKSIIVSAVIISLFSSCGFYVRLPGYEKYSYSDTLVIRIKDSKERMDSVGVFTSYKLFPGEYDNENLFIACSGFYPGYNRVYVDVYLKNGRVIKKDFDVFIVSDVVPDSIILKEKRIIIHDTSSFTQGLVWHNGLLYESTGLKGHSELKIIDPWDGKVLRRKKTDVNLFNEGISIIKDTLYQLTWKDSLLIVYDTLFNEQYRVFNPVEGWGMCSAGDSLCVSNGTDFIMGFNPLMKTFTDTLRVADQYGPVMYINELEWIENAIWANIYDKDLIYVINPVNGKVEAVVNAKELIDRNKYPFAGVMNGIAYDKKTKNVYLTGKNWPFIKVCTIDFGD